MSFDDDRDDDDPSPSGLPLPPEDRLWRHPSELAGPGPSDGPLTLGAPDRSRPWGRWGLVAVSCLAGAAFTLGLVSAGGFVRTRVVERETNRSGGDPDEESARTAAARVTPSVARVDVETGLGPRVGSAVVLGPAGHLVTSTGLVDGATRLTVSFADGIRFPAAVAGTDPVTGLAVLSVPSTSLSPPSVSTSDPAAGELAVTVTGPTDPDGDSLVSAGVVSASGRPVGAPDGSYQAMVQTDRKPVPEARGGAVVDGSGELLGISVEHPGDIIDRSGWAVPADVASRVTNDIVSTGRAQHPWLGIGIDAPEGTAPVSSETTPPTAAPSPAPTAPSTATATSTQAPTTTATTGSTAAPTTSVPVTPASTQAEPIERRGLVVDSVEPGSPAAGVGLEPGDEVIELDGEAVTSMSGLLTTMRRVEPGQKLSLSYRRDGRTHEVEVTLMERPP